MVQNIGCLLEYHPKINLQYATKHDIMTKDRNLIESNEVEKLATNFGFMPVLTGKRYFISYKNEDTARVGEITRRLNQMGVPMWYDYGIEKGELWSREINRNIDECEAIVVFASKTLFAYEDTYVRKEFRLADIYEKKIYVVWLENVTKHDVNKKIMDWYIDVTDLQGINVVGQNDNQIAWSIVAEFQLIKGMAPQPPSPTYQQPVYQPTPQPVRQTQPIKKSYPTPHLNVQVGDRIPFGQYPQGTNGEVQPLEWRVLAVENGRALLITDKLIDYVMYNDKLESVIWGSCTLRKWMNIDFINKAFSTSEQAQIATVTNQNTNNPKYGTKGGNNTQDKIFALSTDEANKYFPSVSDRKAYSTDYAHKKGYDQEDRSGWWWLRSPGYNGFYSAHVSNNGDIDQSGLSVYRNDVTVRPALWLTL